MDKLASSSSHIYGKDFYEDQMEGSIRSAREVVPVILSLVRPSSVVDVGCGVGTWLAAFIENSIEDVAGIDGNYVERSLLQIPASKFQEVDLNKEIPRLRTFDMAISLEVAEHLSPTSSESFVRSLTLLSDVVAFSAAVPGQGGTHHINEQWPEYWQSLFQKRGFILIDCFRNRIWDNKSISCCYRQNLFLYVREDRLEFYPALLEESRKPNLFPLNVVHPEVFQHALSTPPTLRPLVRALPYAVSLAFAKHFPRFAKRVD